MNQDKNLNPDDFLWVIIEMAGDDESILGMEAQGQEKFIPATASKEEALILMGRIPPAQGAQRQAEAMHKERLAQQAAQDGFQVYVVDQNGKILSSLPPGKLN